MCVRRRIFRFENVKYHQNWNENWTIFWIQTPIWINWMNFERRLMCVPSQNSTKHYINHLVGLNPMPDNSMAFWFLLFLLNILNKFIAIQIAKRSGIGTDYDAYELLSRVKWSAWNFQHISELLILSCQDSLMCLIIFRVINMKDQSCNVAVCSLFWIECDYY